MSSVDAPPFRRIAICGVGLIGGSLGLAIKGRWPSIHVAALDENEVVRRAIEIGAADAGAADVTAAAAADLVVLSAPVSVNLALLDGLRSSGTAAVVTDTGSTKRDIVAAAAGLPRFVGGHPIAGAATSGIGSARADLFTGRPWILTPGEGREVPDGLAALLAGIGAHIHVLTAETHDRLLSAVSHLPQLTASALMHVVGESVGDDGLALAGTGLRDTARLASSPAGIWQDVAHANRDHLARDLDALVAALQDLRNGLEHGSGALTRTFESAAAWKRALDRPAMTTAVRTYLEMRSPSALARASRPASDARVERIGECSPSFWRYLYAEVGRQHHWVDRLSWTDADVTRYLNDPAISLWLLSVAGAPAGYFELKRHDDGSIEIAYFGLLAEYHGRGLGGYLLTEATEEAWSAGANRVWLHTSTLDHAHAKANYLKRGFAVFATEEYDVAPI